MWQACDKERSSPRSVHASLTAWPFAKGRTMPLDPVTLAVIQNGLVQVCNEMDLAFSRAAFSPVIAEANDRSDGIYALADGELIAQGELGLPVFVGTMQYATRAVIEAVANGEVDAALEGDVFILNDPYLGGTHLMDVKFVEPFFYQGRQVCWLANTGHWPDIGGTVPGGFSAHATEVEQEGLRLPPVKLYKKGRLDGEIARIIQANIRVAGQRVGDIRAQRAALLVGRRRLTALLDRYGADTVLDATGILRLRAEQQMRALIAPIEDGIYRGEAVVDSDGVVDEPLHVRLSVTKAGSELHFDLSGSSPPCAGPMNCVLATTRSSVWLAIKHVFPQVPINAGMFVPLKIADPEGTFLYARYPRPVSGCAAEVSQRIAEAVFAAMVQAVPELVTAAPAGTSGNLALGGTDPERGRNYVMYHITGGGYGGNARHDGLSYGCSTIGISKSAPHRGPGAAVPRALRGVRPGRGLGRRRPPSRRLRAALRAHAHRRRGQRLVRHGSRPGRAARCPRWRGRRPQPGAGGLRRRPHPHARPPLEGPGHPGQGGRPDPDHHARRRGVRRSERTRPRPGPRRPRARLLHRGRGAPTLRRCGRTGGGRLKRRRGHASTRPGCHRPTSP